MMGSLMFFLPHRDVALLIERCPINNENRKILLGLSLLIVGSTALREIISPFFKKIKANQGVIAY